MGTCEVCESAASKYCCPGCGTRSCSLSCVRSHKKDSGCSGVRCKTKFVSISDFNDNQLFRDYYFLEDVSRVVDSAHREFTSRNYSDTNYHRHHYQLTWVCRRANSQGTKVKLLPPGMSKHQLNTSKTVRDPNSKGVWHIHWRVHLKFACADDVVYQLESVPEDTVLRTLLDSYIHPTSSDPIARHRLEKYVSKGGTDGVEVWLEGDRGTVAKKLEMDITLKDNFRQCVIIEFPTLLVIKGEGVAALTPPSASDKKERSRPYGDKGSDEGEGMAMGVARDLKEEVCCKAEDVKSDSVCVERELEGECDSGREMVTEREDEEWEDYHGTSKEGACPSLCLIASAYGQSDDSDQEQ